MYAEKERGDDTFEDVLRQMRRWAIDSSPQGPVYLGYRLGHIKSDSRVFRAVIYNKAAMVLHMLRRLVGDEVFFRGIRDVLRGVAVPQGGHRRLPGRHGEGQRARPERILRGVDLSAPPCPRLQVRHSVQGSTATVTIEQRGEIIPVPVTITLVYTSGSTEHLTIPVTERTPTPRPCPLNGTLRELMVNQEQCALAVFDAKRPWHPDLDLDLRQVDCRHPGVAVPLERLEHEDETGAAVLVEARQPLAEAAAVHLLPAELGGTAEAAATSDTLVANPELLAVVERQHRNGHGAGRNGGRDAGRQRARDRRAGGGSGAARTAQLRARSGRRRRTGTTGTSAAITHSMAGAIRDVWRERSASIRASLAG